VLEGNIDTVHATFLHAGASEPEWYPEGSYNFYNLNQRYAHFVAVDTEFGARYGAYRPGPEDTNYWRIGKFMFPCWTSEAAGYLGQKIKDNCWVPMDDEHTMVFRIYGKDDGGITGRTETGLIPTNTTDWFGRFNTYYAEENDFLMDREVQRELGNFTGMPYGAANEDNAVQISMGRVLPREIEHLGTSDLMIIRIRQRLLEAAQAYAEHKSSPPALDTPDVYAERSGSTFVPKDADWVEYTEELRRPFVDNGPPDPVRSAGAGFKTNGFRHTRNGPMF
jgi:hypothetical protein